MSASIKLTLKHALELVKVCSGVNPSLDVCLALQVVEYGEHDPSDASFPFNIQSHVAETKLQTWCDAQGDADARAWKVVASNRAALCRAITPLVVLRSSPQGAIYSLDFKQLKARLVSALACLGKSPERWRQNPAKHYMSCVLAVNIVHQFELNQASKLAGHVFSCTRTATGSAVKNCFKLAKEKFHAAVIAADLNDSGKFLKGNPWFDVIRDAGWNPSDLIVAVNFAYLVQLAAGRTAIQASSSNLSMAGVTPRTTASCERQPSINPKQQTDDGKAKAKVEAPEFKTHDEDTSLHRPVQTQGGTLSPSPSSNGDLDTCNKPAVQSQLKTLEDQKATVEVERDAMRNEVKALQKKLQALQKSLEKEKKQQAVCRANQSDAQAATTVVTTCRERDSLPPTKTPCTQGSCSNHALLALDNEHPFAVRCCMVTAAMDPSKWSAIVQWLRSPGRALGLHGLYDKQGSPTALVIATLAHSSPTMTDLQCYFIEVPTKEDTNIRLGLQSILESPGSIKVIHQFQKWFGPAERAGLIKANGHLTDIQLLDNYLQVLKLLNGQTSSVLGLQTGKGLQQMMEHYYPGDSIHADWPLANTTCCWPEDVNAHSTAQAQPAAMPAIMLLMLFDTLRAECQQHVLPLPLLSPTHQRDLQRAHHTPRNILQLGGQQSTILSPSSGPVDTMKLVFTINSEHQLEIMKTDSEDGPRAMMQQLEQSSGDGSYEHKNVDPDVRFMMSLMPPTVVDCIPVEWTVKGVASTIVEFVADSGRPLQIKFAGSTCTESVEALVDMEEMLRHLDRAMHPGQDMPARQDVTPRRRGGLFWLLPQPSVEATKGQMTGSDVVAEISKRLFWRRDNRLTLQQSLHRISAIKDINGLVTGLTMRIGRHIPGVARIIEDVLYAMCRNYEGNQEDTDDAHTPQITPSRGVSLLLVGRPGSGKTTLLRDVIRVLADECRQDVVLVDTSNEVAGEGTIAHPCIGRARRMMVTDRSKQHDVMLEAVHNHMPEVVVIDELGRDEEVKAACEISRRGIMMVATVVSDLKGLIKSNTLNSLVGGLQTVTLGDDMARQTNKGVKTRVERRGAPAFSILVEVLGKRRYRVHPSTAASVDAILADRNPPCHVRSYDDHGNMSLHFESEQQAMQQVSHLQQGQQHGVPRSVLQQHAAVTEACNAVLHMIILGVQTQLQTQFQKAVSSCN